MGLAIVVTLGALAGWLVAIAIERSNRASSAICVLSGATGALTGAAVPGDIPLVAGVTPDQLLWACLGAALAIIAINTADMRRLRAGERRI